MPQLSYYLLIFIFFMGCGGVPLTHFYRIDYELPNPNDSTSLTPVSIRVPQFEADILYNEDRIVYRNSPYEIQYYHYHRWIASPKKIIQEKVIEHLQSSGIFQRVLTYSSDVKPDYILLGKINAFEELDEGETWYGWIRLNFKLQNAETNEIVLEKNFSHKTAAAKQEPVEVVKALSLGLKTVVEDLIEEIENHLKQKIVK